MASNAPVPDFLGEQEVKIPVGGEFQPTGFTGQWQAAHLHTFYAQDTDEASAMDEGVGPDMVEFGWFYYRDYDEAQAAIDKLDVLGYEGKRAQSQHVWRLEAQVPSVLNLNSPEKWGDTVAGNVEMRTLRSRRYRHALHFISLPSAVAAYARLLGHDVEFDISELLEEGQAFTDELYLRLCGDPDEKNLHKSVANAVFKERREALWKTLGEDDWKRYTRHTGDGGKIGKYETVAEPLSTCLTIVEKVWKEPVWAKVMLVPDPRIDAVSNSGNRLTLPVLMEIYRDKAEAEAAVAKEKAERDNGNGSSGGLTYPGIYNEDDENRKAFDEVLANARKQPLPMREKTFIENIGLDGEELEQALEWLK